MQADAISEPTADLYIRITNEYRIHLFRKSRSRTVAVIEGRHGIHTVMHSNGKWSCTCPAYVYHRTAECSHIKIAKMLTADTESRKQILNTKPGVNAP